MTGHELVIRAQLPLMHGTEHVYARGDVSVERESMCVCEGEEWRRGARATKK